MTTRNRGRHGADEIREMFGAIAVRYDLLNHLLSGNLDRRWRLACARGVLMRLRDPEPSVLDIGCGTGDLSLAFADRARVVACDFSLPMLRIGRDKAAKSGRDASVKLLAGDALSLPFRDASFDAAACAFVLRNLAAPQAGLREMRRVLRRGGVVAVLDFSIPEFSIGAAVYRFYFTRVLPKIGRWVSGVEGAYDYLPASVASFARPAEWARDLGSAGFEQVEVVRLSGGVAFLLLGVAAG